MSERASGVQVDPAMLQALEWRLVGPHRGGRVVAVAGHPSEYGTFYFGGCAGGVWKTTDAGVYWQNISDGYFNVGAIGALALAPSDPNVIYAGTGETAIRGNVSHGDGVYKSTDGGRSWRHMGLEDSHAIARVRVHPENPEHVYAAVFGHVWGPSAERGVYRSTDGGEHWQKVLSRDDHSGAIDLSLDERNPRILYATLWDAQRYPHALRSGGPGSGIFRSFDGGDSWEEITRNPGLPEGVLGKIGIAASPAQAGRVYAVVEAHDGAVFRSDDYGSTWQRLSEQGDLRRRAWYYQHIFADPQDPDTVWVLNLKCWKSTDGGKNFFAIPTPHGDNHDLWIDPANSNRMIEGNDGGANVTLNGGLTWSSIFNQPTAQFYHVTTDDRVPYRLYGSQQDNTALSVPSASARGAITQAEWFEPGGGESGYLAVKPNDNDVVVGGAIGSGSGHGRMLRFNHRTMETRIVTVWPEVHGSGRGAKHHKYRFQWTYPIMYSQHNPDALYACSNHVHRSTDEGFSWDVISPDLTRNDAEKFEASGGPITKDNSGAEVYGTIFALAESPLQAGLFWAGSDDGLVHISKDGGQSWQNITPPANLLPEWALISIIEPSPHDAGTAYVAATRYKHDDFAPYIFKTSDYGQSWTKITEGIPANDFTRTVREDPTRKGLLYAGTETAVYVSFDDGAHWQRFQSNLPVVPIHDLLVKESDLIAATHGRSFWILDDLSPLRQLQGNEAQPRTQLFQPRPVDRFRTYGRMGDAAAPYLTYGRTGGMVISWRPVPKANGQVEPEFVDAGKNPPSGAIVYYSLASQPQEVTLTFADAGGNEIRSFSSKGNGKSNGQGQGPQPGTQVGLNRFVWDLRYAPAAEVPGHPGSSPDALNGPIAVPGQYQVILTVDGQSQTQSFEVRKDPRVSGSQQDLQAQFDLLLKIRDAISQTNKTVLQLRDVRAQVQDWAKRVDDPAIDEAARRLVERLNAVELELIQPEAASPLQPPIGLTDKFGALPGMIQNADTKPAKQYYEVFDKLSGELDAQLEQLDQILRREVADFNQSLAQHQVKPVMVPEG
ncbi:MAG TPA: glycosyl hydrolase [Nitrolancea sp.]|nr:glycosyl hydrolase [Nitrolancea sp.]